MTPHAVGSDERAKWLRELSVGDQVVVGTIRSSGSLGSPMVATVTKVEDGSIAIQRRGGNKTHVFDHEGRSCNRNNVAYFIVPATPEVVQAADEGVERWRIQKLFAGFTREHLDTLPIETLRKMVDLGEAERAMGDAEVVKRLGGNPPPTPPPAPLLSSWSRRRVMGLLAHFVRTTGHVSVLEYEKWKLTHQPTPRDIEVITGMTCHSAIRAAADGFQGGQHDWSTTGGAKQRNGRIDP